MNHRAIHRRYLSRTLTALVVPAFLGCSLTVDADRKVCSTDLDCQNRGPAFAASLCVNSYCEVDPRWACAKPSPEMASQPAVSATMMVMDMTSFTGLADVKVSLCGTLDLQCATPLAVAHTDATGVAPVSVPQSYNGYVLIEHEAIEPYLFFPSFPIEEGKSMGIAIVSPKGGIQALAGQLSDVVMNGRGVAIVQIQDCLQPNTLDFATMQFATDVSVEWLGNITGSHPYYSVNGIPTGLENAKVTDSTGMAGLLNALPGTQGIRIKFGTRSVAEVSMIVREGHISYGVVNLGAL